MKRVILLLLSMLTPLWSAVPNETPTLAPITDVTVLEDSGVQGVALSGISYGADGAAQTISISATSDNLAVLLDPTVVYSSPQNTGTLLLAPVPDRFGTAVVTVTVRDDGGTTGGSVDTVTRTFLVTVLPVNDPPGMTAPSDRTIDEDDPQQDVALGGITIGSASEAGQVITISAVSSNPALIPDPVITYTSPQGTGTLSFTPVAHRSGTATILVTVGDDGGTTNGGVDTSYYAFTVTVAAIPHVPVVVSNAGLTLPVATSAVVARSALEVDDYGPAAQLVYTLTAVPGDGDLRRGGVTLTTGGTFSQADINAGLVVYRHTGVADTVDGFTFTVTNTENNTLPATTFTITVTGVAGGTTPVVTLPGSGATFVQGGGPVVLDNGATVTDASGTLVGGTLTVSLVSGSESGDAFGIRNVGTAPGQIGVSGGVVTYGGSTIGTASGGSGGAALSVALAGTATPTAVEALLRNVRFNNTDTAPTSAVRTVQVVLVNGTGGASAPVTTTVQVQPVNQAPVVTLPKVTIAYLEASGPVVLDDSATVLDADSPVLVGGVLSATWTAGATADDHLAVRDEGAGAGQIALVGAAVWWNGAQIATVSGGTAGSPFSATLTAAATPAAVQALLRNLVFDNQSATPALALRTLSVTLSDGEGGTSTAATLTVVVQSSDNPPVLTLPSPPPTWVQGTGWQVLDAGAIVTDVDSAAFDTGLLVVEFTAGATVDDRLEILHEGNGPSQIAVVGDEARYGGVTIGEITGPGTLSSALVVRLDADATVAATQALIRRVAFTTVGVPPAETPRSVRVYLTDGAGGTSLPQTTTLAVQAVNAAPVVTLPTGMMAWTEHATASLIDAAATVSDSDSASLSGGALAVTIEDFVDGDQLSIRSTGVGSGQVSVSGTSVLVSGVVVGVIQDDPPTTLTVVFTAQGTPTAAQAILRAVQFAHTGQFTSVETRTLSVTVDDGLGASAPATTLITLTPVDDPPTTSALTLGTVVDVPVRATLPGADPEEGALTWEIVTLPVSGTLVLDDASTGAVTYTPASGQTMQATFTFRVGDGTTWSAPSTATIKLSTPLAEVRPLIVSSPVREGVIGQTYSYQVTIDTSALPPGYDLRFQVVGQPAGATVDITRDTATTATLTWDQTGAPDVHRQLGLLVSDAITGTASYQAVQVLWLATAPGGAG